MVEGGDDVEVVRGVMVEDGDVVRVEGVRRTEAEKEIRRLKKGKPKGWPRCLSDPSNIRIGLSHSRRIVHRYGEGHADRPSFFCDISCISQQSHKSRYLLVEQE
nr:hypothetical protein Iba_chr14dCG18010 [Ipomoea batatas]